MGADSGAPAARIKACASRPGPARRGLASSSVAAVLLACSGPPGAGRRLGEDLGTFHVDAVETTNSCGPDALGSSPRFDFEVELSRADTELFWDGRVGGQVRSSLDFDFQTQNTFALRPPRGPDEGCAVARQDSVRGTLRANAAGEIDSFAGAMTYDFLEADPSTCTFEDQQAAGLPRLPCRLSYRLDGERTRAPEGLPQDPTADLQ